MTQRHRANRVHLVAVEIVYQLTVRLLGGTDVQTSASVRTKEIRLAPVVVHPPGLTNPAQPRGSVESAPRQGLVARDLPQGEIVAPAGRAMVVLARGPP